LCTPELQAAPYLGDGGCGNLRQDYRQDTSEFTGLDPWLRLEPPPQPANVPAKVVRTSPFCRHSLKQLYERELELISQSTEMIKPGPDSAGNPSLEGTRAGACKGGQVLLCRTFTLAQAPLQIRTESRGKAGTLQPR
jgi:hypothetical protein